MANQIVQVEFHTMCGGQYCVNVLHFVGDTAETDLFIIARSIVRSLDGTDTNTGFTAEKYMTPLTSNCFLSSISARVVGVVTGSKYPKLYPEVSFPGGEAGNMYSTTLAANIKLVTASGPDFTGRTFLPGVPEGYIVDNRFAADYVTIIGTWRSDLLDGIEVGAVTFAPAVYNRTTKTAELVTNSQLVPNPGTIRKRATPY